MFLRRSASAPLIFARSRAVGSKRCRRPRACARCRRAPCAPPGAAAGGSSGCRRRARRGSGPGWTFGCGLASGSVDALLDLARPRGARVDLDRHVLEAGARAAAAAGVRSGSAAAYLLSISIVTTASPFSSVDARDVADLDAGDVDRLALARGHRLGGAELGLELEAVVAQDRDPGREGCLLLERITPVVTSARTTRTTIATKSRRCSRIARSWHGLGSGAADAPAGPLRSGTALRVAGDVHPERRLAARREAAGGCRAAPRCCCRTAASCSGDRVLRVRRMRTSCRAAAGLEAHERAVAVEALALAARARRRRRRTRGSSAGRW